MIYKTLRRDVTYMNLWYYFDWFYEWGLHYATKKCWSFLNTWGWVLLEYFLNTWGWVLFEFFLNTWGWVLLEFFLNTWGWVLFEFFFNTWEWVLFEFFLNTWGWVLVEFFLNIWGWVLFEFFVVFYFCVCTLLVVLSVSFLHWTCPKPWEFCIRHIYINCRSKYITT
jgi:hypothetical protein